MNEADNSGNPSGRTVSFFQRPEVQLESIPVGKGVPLGIERVSNPDLGIGGAYGTWGEGYDNNTLPGFIEQRLGKPLSDADKLNLSPLGFDSRHHISELSDQENFDLEVAVGARFLKEAARACGWRPEEVEGVLIGMSGPVSDDYTERIAREAGIPEHALKLSVHKACDSSMGALHMALNPDLEANQQTAQLLPTLEGPAGAQSSLAERLLGKKILVGGIEGLSRFISKSRDANALQLFGNGAGVIGVIPGKTMKFLVGKAHEVFDEKGVLAVRMYYPYTRHEPAGQSLVEVTQAGPNHIRVAGMMHEPDSAYPVEMAGPMGMVKLFVRNGVQVVSDVYQAYRKLMDEIGTPQKSIVTIVVHHANLKINQLKAQHLEKEGVHLPIPWVMNEFGNVSAASNMIAFLRQISGFRPGDHILFDGFGAGTYYDVFAVAL
jgi:hypothetical protein